MPRDRQRAVMWWLTRGGPFWWRDRRHGGDDYLESQGDLVTESAIAEAAFRTLHDAECGLMSFSPSDWNQSPISVIWRREAEGFDDESVAVENFWTVDNLEERLGHAMAPIQSWIQLRQVSERGFPRLTFGEDCFSALRALPFRRSAATRILELLRILDRFAEAFHADGGRSREGHRIYRDHFTGDNALFSDSSPTEKREFGLKLRFPHPDEPEEGSVMYLARQGSDDDVADAGLGFYVVHRAENRAGRGRCMPGPPRQGLPRRVRYRDRYRGRPPAPARVALRC